MPITPAQLVQILTSRNIGVRPVLIPGQPTRWKAGTYNQTHAEGRAHRGTYPTPEEAVEAAEATLAAADARHTATLAERLLSSLDDGGHYLKPREVDVQIPGEPAGKKRVWDVVDAKTGTVTELVGLASPRAAMEALADKKAWASQPPAASGGAQR